MPAARARASRDSAGKPMIVYVQFWAFRASQSQPKLEASISQNIRDGPKANGRSWTNLHPSVGSL